VFGALAGINGQDDFEVVLGSLLGAAVFVTTVVLGTVLLVARPRAVVSRETFLRDVLAYMVTVLVINIIARDDKVTLWDAVSGAVAAVKTCSWRWRGCSAETAGTFRRRVPRFPFPFCSYGGMAGRLPSFAALTARAADS